MRWWRVQKLAKTSKRIHNLHVEDPLAEAPLDPTPMSDVAQAGDDSISVDLASCGLVLADREIDMRSE